MSIIPLLGNSSSFDPEAVEILSAAFDDAWEEIKRSGSTLARPAYERGRSAKIDGGGGRLTMAPWC